MIPKRRLGKTGHEVSILAFGGFHLIEVLPSDAQLLLNTYMDAGGNFIETAVSYGDSEKKIGRAIKGRRDQIFLSSKTHYRPKKEAAQSINKSLSELGTDYLDNLFMHAVNTPEQLEQILAEDGAIAAATDAVQAGKVRYIGITSHRPETLLTALKSYNFDIVMEWNNYYDYFNFPLIYDEIIPLCTSQDIGLVAMKALADGLLYRSPKEALRWTWSQPIASIAAGNNNLEMLQSNIRLAENFTLMSEAEKQELYKNAPEYNNYVCRRCGECTKNKLGLDPMAIFTLEGYFDRQMYDGTVPNAAEYALRERLKHWFGNQDFARERYKKEGHEVPTEVSRMELGVNCPYNIDIPRKLSLAAWKLTGCEQYIGQ